MTTEEIRTPSFEEVMSTLIDRELVDFCTSCPGRVERYSRATQRAQVQPLVKRGRRDETGARVPVRRPVVPNVLIVWPGVFHVEPGDLVWLVFSDASLERWLAGGGGEVDPGDDRHHQASDAVAFPLASPRPREASSLAEVVLGRPEGPSLQLGPSVAVLGGSAVGAQQTLMASTYLSAMNVLLNVIAEAVGASGSPPSATAAGEAISAAILVFNNAAATYLSQIARVR